MKINRKKGKGVRRVPTKKEKKELQYSTVHEQQFTEIIKSETNSLTSKYLFIEHPFQNNYSFATTNSWVPDMPSPHIYLYYNNELFLLTPFFIGTIMRRRTAHFKANIINMVQQLDVWEWQILDVCMYYYVIYYSRINHKMQVQWLMHIQNVALFVGPLILND